MLVAQEQNSKGQSLKVKKIQQYIFCEADKIGAGRFSQVYSGVDKNIDEAVAVKVVQLSSLKSKTAHQLLQNQISILKDLNHPNIIKCRDVITSIHNCYIVFDLCEADLQCLLNKKGTFLEEEIYKIVYDLYKGLLYLNTLSVVHRDLKAANVFIGKNKQTRIADFGFATKADCYFKDITIGSPIYMSPQGLVSQIYSPKTDVWSFGVLIYELVHGKPPLAHCKSEEQLKEQILLQTRIQAKISVQLREFIGLCLTKYPQQRPDIKDLCKTEFMKKVFYKVEQQKYAKTLTQTGHSMGSTTVTKNSVILMEVEESIVVDVENNQHKLLECALFKGSLSYEEALALVHYCRLIYKTCKINESKILIEWLLLISYSLNNIKINQKRNQTSRLNEVIKQYNAKYSQQYQQISNTIVNRFGVTIVDVINECRSLKKGGDPTPVKSDTPKSQNGFTKFKPLNIDISPKSKNHLKVLLKETEQLRDSLKQNKLEHFSKSSQIQYYLKKQL